MKTKNYNDLDAEHQQVINDFLTLKLKWDYSRFRLYKYQVEDLITDYEQMIQLRKNIQAKYYEIIQELNEVELIEGELDVHEWTTHRDQEDFAWSREMELLDELRAIFEIGIKMIESGKAKKALVGWRNGKK